MYYPTSNHIALSKHSS